MEKQKVIKIGLSGFEFHKANMGCEALTYSFLKIIGDSVDNKKIDSRNVRNYWIRKPRGSTKLGRVA